MKTRNLKQTAKSLGLIAIAILTSSSLMGQLVGLNQVEQDSIEERKGNISTYTVPGPVTDEYSWEVIGGTVVDPAVGVTGGGTTVDPYVVPFTAGQQTIQVEWPADNNSIDSLVGNVSVQRQAASGTIDCPSSIQSLDIFLWSAATAAIQDADYEICSGDATLGDITVEFTGAPDFDFQYTITDLDGTTGAPVVETGVAVGTFDIPIPANLVNTSTTDDQTYIVTITEMNDSFTGLGNVTDATFTITVHPTVSTGDISSDNPLTRR